MWITKPLMTQKPSGERPHGFGWLNALESLIIRHINKGKVRNIAACFCRHPSYGTTHGDA
jgi:hypothetical protein